MGIAMKIKICGIRREEDVWMLNESMPDYAGFVFADTRRKVTAEQALKLRQQLDRKIPVFGVFVNAPLSVVCDRVRDGCIDAVQLHGDETERYIRELRGQVSVPVVKAVRVRRAEDITEADRLSCDFLLLDTFSPDQYGGTGRTFCWDIIPESLSHPLFLAGGLSEQNIQEAMEHVNCFGVDVSGGVETEGVKDPVKIKRMVEMVHQYHNIAEWR